MSEKLQSVKEYNRPSHLERRGNVVDIYKPEGIYTIIYGQHTRVVDPALLPNNLSGLILETGDDLTWPKHPLNSLYDFMMYPQYNLLNKRIIDEKIPIFFADTYIKNEFVKDVNETEVFLMVLESSIGALIVRDILKRLVDKEKIS